jgi:hypothetical protein
MERPALEARTESARLSSKPIFPSTSFRVPVTLLLYFVWHVEQTAKVKQLPDALLHEVFLESVLAP